jgi:nitroimidazol reductase NimA-like FMN-containing flavoprotein (pyridoxamine 5'-phosphate oxidase superfamily)
MSEFHNKRVVEIISKVLYITIATVNEDGQPWNSPVYSGFDDELNFYWSSDKDSNHSKNVRRDSRIFLVIYDSTVPEGAGEGAYILAKAYELREKEEIIIARRITQARKNQLDEITSDENEKFTGSKIRRVYKAIPEKIWMNDVELDDNGKYIRDIRVEVPINELKKFLKTSVK